MLTQKFWQAQKRCVVYIFVYIKYKYTRQSAEVQEFKHTQDNPRKSVESSQVYYIYVHFTYTWMGALNNQLFHIRVWKAFNSFPV